MMVDFDTPFFAYKKAIYFKSHGSWICAYTMRADACPSWARQRIPEEKKASRDDAQTGHVRRHCKCATKGKKIEKNHINFHLIHSGPFHLFFTFSCAKDVGIWSFSIVFCTFLCSSKYLQFTNQTNDFDRFFFKYLYMFSIFDLKFCHLSIWPSVVLLCFYPCHFLRLKHSLREKLFCIENYRKLFACSNLTQFSCCGNWWISRHNFAAKIANYPGFPGKFMHEDTKIGYHPR